MSDELDVDDYYDELAQRLHENREAECVPGCWMCSADLLDVADFVGPIVGVDK